MNRTIQNIFLLICLFIGANQASAQSEETIYSVPDILAQYPGGTTALFGYISAELKYPSQAKADFVEGRVMVEFVVEKDGSVSNTKVIKGIGSGCDAEAIRVVQNSKNWIAGKNDGEDVRVKMTLPIKFSLPE